MLSTQGVSNQGVILPTRVLYCPPRVCPTQQPCCCPTLPCSTCQGLLLQPLWLCTAAFHCMHAMATRCVT